MGGGGVKKTPKKSDVFYGRPPVCTILSTSLLSGCKGKNKALLLSKFDSVAYSLNLLLVSQTNLLKDKTIA